MGKFCKIQKTSDKIRKLIRMRFRLVSHHNKLSRVENLKNRPQVLPSNNFNPINHKS